MIKGPTGGFLQDGRGGTRLLCRGRTPQLLPRIHEHISRSSLRSRGRPMDEAARAGKWAPVVRCVERLIWTGRAFLGMDGSCLTIGAFSIIQTGGFHDRGESEPACVSGLIEDIAHTAEWAKRPQESPHPDDQGFRALSRADHPTRRAGRSARLSAPHVGFTGVDPGRPSTRRIVERCGSSSA